MCISAAWLEGRFRWMALRWLLAVKPHLGQERFLSHMGNQGAEEGKPPFASSVSERSLSVFCKLGLASSGAEASHTLAAQILKLLLRLEQGGTMEGIAALWVTLPPWSFSWSSAALHHAGGWHWSCVGPSSLPQSDREREWEEGGRQRGSGLSYPQISRLQL